MLLNWGRYGLYHFYRLNGYDVDFTAHGTAVSLLYGFTLLCNSVFTFIAFFWMILYLVTAVSARKAIIVRPYIILFYMTACVFYYCLLDLLDVN